MQHSVSLSSAEAAFFGAMLAAKDLLFLRDLFTALGIGLGGATVVYSDSKSAVDMSLDPVAFKNTKHILRSAEFLRDLVAKEVLAPAPRTHLRDVYARRFAHKSGLSADLSAADGVA